LTEAQPISGGFNFHSSSPFASPFNEQTAAVTQVVEGGKKKRSRSPRRRVRGGDQNVKGGSAVVAPPNAEIAAPISGGSAEPVVPIVDGSIAGGSIAGGSIAGGSPAVVEVPIVGGSAPVAAPVEAGGADAISGGRRRRNSAVIRTHSRVMEEYHKMKADKKKFRGVPGNILLRMAMERSKTR
jgi:hypothetical protein